MQTWDALGVGGKLNHKHLLADRATIFSKEQPAQHVYFLQKGVVEIFQNNDDGGGILVKLLVAPSLFGVIEAIGDEKLYLENVRSFGEVAFFRMQTETFLSVIKQYPAAMLECLRDMSTAFCVAAKHESAIIFSNEARLANLLLSYVDADGERYDGGLRMQSKRTQADLAAGIGTSERTVNTILTAWKSDGLIAKSDGRYVVVAREALERIAGELYGSLVHTPHGEDLRLKK